MRAPRSLAQEKNFARVDRRWPAPVSRVVSRRLRRSPPFSPNQQPQEQNKPQIPGGWAAQIYGGRKTLLGSFLAWSLLSLLTPMRGAVGGGDSGGGGARAWPVAAARWGVGAAQGFLIPAVHTVLSQWVPPHERARAVSLATSGMYLGSAAAMLVLPAVVAAAGPGASVCLVGALGLAWAALWAAVGREVPHREAIIPLSVAAAAPGGGGGANGGVAFSPASNGGGKGGGGGMSGGGGGERERERGRPASPPRDEDAGQSAAAAATQGKGRPAATPWRRMLATPAVLAIVCNNFAFHYAFYVVLNWLPTFFSAVLGADLAAMGALPKVAPYVAMFACSNAGGWAGDWLIAQPRGWRVADARKAVNGAGMLSASAALLLMPLCRRPATGVAAGALVLSTLGFSRGGFSVNHMDIAPRHAGVVMGFSNTAGTLSGVIGVAATGWMLQRAGGAERPGGWWAAHGVAAAGCVGAAGVFQAYARGDKMFD